MGNPRVMMMIVIVALTLGGMCSAQDGESGFSGIQCFGEAEGRATPIMLSSAEQAALDALIDLVDSQQNETTSTYSNGRVREHFDQSEEIIRDEAFLTKFEEVANLPFIFLIFDAEMGQQLTSEEAEARYPGLNEQNGGKGSKTGMSMSPSGGSSEGKMGMGMNRNRRYSHPRARRQTTCPNVENQIVADKNYWYTATYYPRAAIVHVFIEYENGDTSVCSGSLISEDLVVLAGHCVYTNSLNPDPSKAGFPKSGFVVPANHDQHYPYADTTNWEHNIQFSERPFGAYEILEFHVTQAWVDYAYDNTLTKSANLKIAQQWDMGLVRINSPIGRRVGWLGYNDFYPLPDIVNHYGYPAEEGTADNPFPGRYLYERNTTQIDRASITRMVYEAKGPNTWGGDSGGPHIHEILPEKGKPLPGKNEGESMFLVRGVQSSRALGVTCPEITFKRINGRTIDWFLLLTQVSAPVPDEQPQIISFTRSANAEPAGLSHLENLQIGGQLTAFVTLQNVGFAKSNAITVKFYLSDDEIWTPTDNDVQVGEKTVDGMVPDFYFKVLHTFLLGTNYGRKHVIARWFSVGQYSSRFNQEWCGTVTIGTTSVIGGH